MLIKKLVQAVLVLVLGGFIILSCNSKSSGKWVAKIDGEIISLDTFNMYYYANQKSIYNESDEEIDKRAANPDEVSKNPLLDKTEFLENFIRQRLVYKKAIEAGTLKNKEMNALLDMAKEALVVGYYVREKYKNDIEVKEDEIGKVYSQQKERFRGAPIDQAEQYIRQQLMQQKLQLKLREFVEFLRDESKIEKNLDIFKPAKPDSVTEKDKKDKK